MVSLSALAVAVQLPLGGAFDETGQARFAESYTALAVEQARGSAPQPVLRHHLLAPLLPRTWSAPMMRSKHDEGIVAFDELPNLSTYVADSDDAPVGNPSQALRRDDDDLGFARTVTARSSERQTDRVRRRWTTEPVGEWGRPWRATVSS